MMVDRLRERSTVASRPEKVKSTEEDDHCTQQLPLDYPRL